MENVTVCCDIAEMLCQDTAKDRVDTIPMNAKSNGDSGC